MVGKHLLGQSKKKNWANIKTTALKVCTECSREIEWLFSSDAGRLQLAESAGYERLVVVTMHRSHTYPNLADVKEEVSTKAVELLQQGLPYGKQVTAMIIIMT